MLSRLSLSEDECKKYVSELSSILSYIEILNELDISDVKPSYQVTGLVNVLDKDEVLSEKWCEKEDLLAASQLAKRNDQIEVKAVMD